MKNIDKQKILLRAIFKACGGPTVLERATGIPKQNFTNWQIRGVVPLLKATKISNLMGISKWGLNYVGFCEVNDNSPEWEDVVKSYFLTKDVFNSLMEGEPLCQKNKEKKNIVKKKKKKKKSLPAQNLNCQTC